ncbi:HAMP domain-containing histidine kinase [Patescibacteria group bacterium]|nr:HAMP domain-containing histidine kinase [Patescibacteria group bacterium]
MTFIVIIFAVSSYLLLYYNILNNLEKTLNRTSQEIIEQYLRYDEETGLQVVSNQSDTTLSDDLFIKNLSLRIVDKDKNIITQLGSFKKQIKPSQSKINNTLFTGNSSLSIDDDIDSNQNIYLAAPIIIQDNIVGVIELSQPTGNSFTALQQLGLILIAGIFASIAISVAAGYYLSRSLLGYINQLIDNVEAITRSQDLEKRLPVPNKYKDELTRLAGTFNNMLVNLQSEFIREKNFTANVSHDLRTPITIIQGNVDLALRKKTLTPGQTTKTLHKIKHETKRMGAIIDDLLELSSIEKNQNTQFQKLNLVKVLNQIVNNFQDKILAKNIILVYKKPKNNNKYQINGRLEQIERLLSNIIDNSIKYNKQNGKIIIKLSQKLGKIYVSIQDTGPGISTKHLPYIFDRHYQVTKSETGIIQGFGLGLSIAKEIVKIHSGKIYATSKVNQGTTIKIVFPQFT